MTSPTARHLREIAFTLILTVFLCDQLSAETTEDLSNFSLEDLMMVPVTGASRFDQKISDAPAAVTIITADDIQKFGYRTLADILRSARGVTVSYDRNYSYAGLRGFSSTGDYNSRFLVQIDGHRINENIYNDVLIGTEFILDVDLIDRVEIIRGSNASLYGSNAFFGVINIITKNSSKFGKPQLAGSYGSNGTLKGRASFGEKVSNDTDLAISGTGYYSKGQDYFYQEFADYQSGGFSRNADNDESGSLFGRMAYGHLTFSGAFVSRDKTIPTGAFDTDINSKDTFTIDQRWYLDAKYQNRIASNVDLTARLFYDEYRYKGHYSYSGSVNQDLALAKTIGSEITLSKPFLNETHRLTGGVEFLDNISLNQRNEDLNPYNLYLDSEVDNQKWSSFLQDDYRVTHWLRLNAGVCLDHSQETGNLLNPRLGAIIQPYTDTTIKLLYGTALRPPNVYELFYEDGITSKKPDHLDPEKNTTYEAIIEQRFWSKYRMSTGVFHYDISDMIRQVEDPDTNLLVFKNAGEMTADGIEFELEGVWSSSLRGNISYTYQDTKDVSTGAWPVNSPRHIGKANVIVPFFSDDWSIGTNLQYISPRRTYSGTDTDPVWLVNMTLLAKNVTPGLTVSLSGYNLLNQKYSDPVGLEFRQPSIEQDGVTFLIKMVFTHF